MDAVITAACPWKSAMNGRFSIKSRSLWAAKTRCQTWPMSTNIAKVFFWNAARKRDEMLELYDGKLSRTVLRRESGSNPADLAGACPHNHRHDWDSGEIFPELEEIAPMILPQNYENLSDEFLIEQVIPKTDHHLQASDAPALRKNAKRAFKYQHIDAIIGDEL